MCISCLARPQAGGDAGEQGHAPDGSLASRAISIIRRAFGYYYYYYSASFWLQSFRGNVKNNAKGAGARAGRKLSLSVCK